MMGTGTANDKTLLTLQDATAQRTKIAIDLPIAVCRAGQLCPPPVMTLGDFNGNGQDQLQGEPI
jgi:hypothetical protein